MKKSTTKLQLFLNIRKHNTKNRLNSLKIASNPKNVQLYHPIPKMPPNPILNPKFDTPRQKDHPILSDKVEKNITKLIKTLKTTITF